MLNRDLLTPQRISRLPHTRNGYPIIATIHRDENGRAGFDTVEDTRKLILGILDWCGVCGLPLGETDRHLVTISRGDRDRTGGTHTTEPPVHAICAHYSARVCPYLLTPGKTIRKGPAQGKARDTLELVRYRRTSGISWRPEGITFTLMQPDRPVVLDDDETFRQLLENEPPVELSTRHRLLLRAFEATDPLPVLFAAAVAAAHAPNVHLHDLLGELMEQARGVAHLHESQMRGHPQYKLVPLMRAWLREHPEDTPPVIQASMRNGTPAR